MTGLGLGGAIVRVDMRAALAVAEAEGCAPRLAPALLRAVQEGLAAAQAATEDGDTPTGATDGK